MPEGQLMLTPEEYGVQATQRAEQQTQLAEQQTQFAEEATQRAERLAAKLRELNIDPDIL
jgi:hypothetical protein